MSIASTRSRPGSTSTTGCREERATALAALLAEARRDPPNPGNAEERLPDEGNAERLERFLAGDRPTVVYFGKLMRNKGVHVLLEALDGDRRPRRDRRVRRRPRASWSGWRAPRRPVHGPAGAPAPRAPARPRGRVRRAVDLPRGVRDGRRRGRRGRVPAARRAPLGARGDRRRARGGVPAGAAPPRGVRLGRRRRPAREADASCSRWARRTGRPSARQPGGPRWSGGAGRASPTGCWSRSATERESERPSGSAGRTGAARTRSGSR